MPTAPAFSLLDQSPTVIDQPTSARALASGIYQTFDQKTGLPSSYAVELTPFWFVKHPGMSLFRFYGTDDKAIRPVSFPQPLRASLSLAFVNPAQSSSDNATTENKTASFSYGARFSLFKAVRKKDLETLKTRVEQAVNELKGTETELEAAAPIALKVTDEKEYNRRVAEFLAVQKTKPQYVNTKNSVSEVLSRKPLASIDVAGASSRYFPNQTFSTNRKGRTGIWLTANLAAQFEQSVFGTSNKKGYISLYLIGRYLSDQTLADTTKAGSYLDLAYTDGGGKLELELSNLIFSYELVSRKVSGTDKERNPTVGSGWRSVGNIKYRIGNNAFITGAFGKNFGVRDNLLYTLGINWTIQAGTEKVKIEEPAP